METMEIKLSNKIYSSIQHDIVTGAISDQMFLTEKDLAERYQVSKAPVRDALHLLCGQGYLVSYPRKGYMVRRYSRRDIQQMQQVRLQLEMLAVQLVIENASDSEIESLRKCNQPCENATDPSMTWNAQFHIRLAEISGNPYLPETLQNLVNNVARYWIHVHLDFSKHEALVNALLERNLDHALEALKEDLAEA